VTAIRAEVLLGGLAILSLAYGTFGAFLDAERHDKFLWDLDYYRAAAERWSAGLDPYLSNSAPTGYYYSVTVTPLVGRLFSGFEAELLYTGLMSVALMLALAMSLRAVRAPPPAALLCWLYTLAFGNAEAVYVLASGNLACFTGLILAAALVAASRDKWVPFYLLVGIAALIKPYALLLLAVPFALRKVHKAATISVIPWAFDTAVTWTLLPELASSRVNAIRVGVIEPLQLRYSFSGRLSRVLADQLELEASTATLIAVLAQLALAMAFALSLRLRPPTDARRHFALAVVAAFAALPRMAGYDAFIFGPPVLVAFLPRSASGRSSSVVVAILALLSGLLKEGLAILPLLALVAWQLTSRERKEQIA
jgi:hypothetical protein